MTVNRCNDRVKRIVARRRTRKPSKTKRVWAFSTRIVIKRGTRKRLTESVFYRRRICSPRTRPAIPEPIPHGLRRAIRYT